MSSAVEDRSGDGPTLQPNTNDSHSRLSTPIVGTRGEPAGRISASPPRDSAWRESSELRALGGQRSPSSPSSTSRFTDDMTSVRSSGELSGFGGMTRKHSSTSLTSHGRLSPPRLYGTIDTASCAPPLNGRSTRTVVSPGRVGVPATSRGVQCTPVEWSRYFFPSDPDAQGSYKKGSFFYRHFDVAVMHPETPFIAMSGKQNESLKPPPGWTNHDTWTVPQYAQREVRQFMDRSFQTLYYLTGWVPKDYYFGDAGRVGEFEAKIRWPEPGGRAGSVGSGKMKFVANDDDAGIELLEFCRYVCSLLPRTPEDYKHLVRLQQGLLLYMAELYDIQYGLKSWPDDSQDTMESLNPQPAQDNAAQSATAEQGDESRAAELMEQILEYTKQLEKQDARLKELQDQLEVAHKRDAERDGMIIVLEQRITQMEEHKLGDTTEVISSLEKSHKILQEELEQAKGESQSWERQYKEMESTVLELKRQLKQVTKQEFEAEQEEKQDSSQAKDSTYAS